MSRVEARYTLVALFVFAVLLAGLAVLLTSCAAKPCPVALQVKYTATLVEACGDAGSMAECRKTQAYADARAAHREEQRVAGCRE